MQSYYNRTIILSGGFDPVHVGHVRMFQDASAKGTNQVIVLLNSDAWLTRKKGRPFMLYEQRHEIISAFKGVSLVHPVDDSDGTVVKGLQQIAAFREWMDLPPMYFGNGGDRTSETTPSAEQNFCIDNNIGLLFNLGGEKIQSSSELIREWEEARETADELLVVLRQAS